MAKRKPYLFLSFIALNWQWKRSSCNWWQEIAMWSVLFCYCFRCYWKYLPAILEFLISLVFTVVAQCLILLPQCIKMVSLTRDWRSTCMNYHSNMTLDTKENWWYFDCIFQPCFNILLHINNSKPTTEWNTVVTSLFSMRNTIQTKIPCPQNADSSA